MFGILYTLSYLFGSGYEHIRRHKETRLGKKRGIERRVNGENKKNIYFDWQGHEHDLDSDKKVMFYFDYKGHYIEKEVEGPILKDLTQEFLDEKMEYDMHSEKQVIMLYDYRALMKMWDLRFNQGKKKYAYTPYPSETNITIYKHCKTGKLCLMKCIPYKKNILFMESAKEISGYGTLNLDQPVIIDLLTGLIIEMSSIDGKDQNKSRFSYYKSGSTTTLGEYIMLTDKECEDIIDNWNKLINKGDLPRIATEWSILF